VTSDSSPAVAPADLRDVVAGVLKIKPDDIDDDTNLVHLGLKSLQLMQLVNHWRREGLTANFRELAACPTLAHWRTVLHR
jgi:bifunctional isochorismate lyase/aryl carrier protein